MERSVDTVLIIVEPSFESIALAEKIGYMADGIGVNRVRAISNKVPSEKIKMRIAGELAETNGKAIERATSQGLIRLRRPQAPPWPIFDSLIFLLKKAYKAFISFLL